MNKTVSTFSKGIATGIAVGTAVGMITRPMDIRKRARMKKKATKALRTFGDIVSSAQNMIK
jgi:hypothetical protein